MASKKKVKPKAKKKTRKTPTRKAASRKKSAPKTKARSKLKKKAKAAPKKKRAAVRPPAVMPKPALPTVPPGTARVGVVTHYFSHLSVAIVQLETGNLRVGDVIHIKGHTSDFTQRIESMEVDHVHVTEARAGQIFGLRVAGHAREHDVVYKAGA